MLYVHEGRLYQFITPNRPESERRSNFRDERNARIWVAVSEDEGVTWSKPVPVIWGSPNYTSGGQTALLKVGNRLYWTVSERYQTLAVIGCDLERGLLNPAAWRISDLVTMPVPPELVGGSFSDGSQMRCLEGNVVEVGGRRLVIARAIINRLGTANMGAVFEIHDDGLAEKLRLEFVQLHPIPGGQCKFYIQYDARSKLYWMASNLPTNSQDLIQLGKTEVGRKIKEHGTLFSLREDRRVLALWYSLDALNWIPAGCVAKADKWTQSFMYPVTVIDGDDLILISRTARESPNFHDADLATFHRIRNFRELAFDLVPRD